MKIKEIKTESSTWQKLAEVDQVKNYRVWYNQEHEVIYFKQLHSLTAEDAYVLLPLVQKMIKDKPHRYVMVDLTEGRQDMVGKEARRAFRETTSPKDFDKVAVFGANAVVRMIAKVVVAITGVSDITRFFKTEDEALAWLKGE